MDTKTIDAAKSIKGVWKQPFGLLLSIILAICVLWGLKVTNWIFYLIASVSVVLFWLIHTQRLYFRDRWLSVFWLVILSVPSALFSFMIYPKFIEASKIDFPYIQIWGSAIVFTLILLIFLFLKVRVFTSKKLLIVLFVVNYKPEIEELVRDSIRKAVDNIMDQQNDIRIIVPTFGICSRIKSCERYIRNPFTRADAFIRTKVEDAGHENDIDYVFTEFTSRVNIRRKVDNGDSISFLSPVDEVQKYRDWNYKNVKQKEIACKIRIRENIESMLRMYVASIYMLKNQYETALPIADNLFQTEARNSPINNLAGFILGSAYLFASQEEEHTKHDYQKANGRLKEFIERFPNQSENNQYIQAMARVQFYLGDLRESKRFTKKIKDINNPDSMFAYNLNMGFYALYEKKYPEFTNWYKNIYKLHPSKAQVRFAIQFLKYELKTTSDAEYKIGLNYAVAFLTLFINLRKAKLLWKKAKILHSDSTFEKLDELVSRTDTRLTTC